MLRYDQLSDLSSTQKLRMILSYGTNSYIYGPDDPPVEQINTEGHVTYLHHDQQGSTRLLTGEKGEVTGSYTYGAYGETTGHTGTATTPLGYDAQYTNSDTGADLHAGTGVRSRDRTIPQR